MTTERKESPAAPAGEPVSSGRSEDAAARRPLRVVLGVDPHQPSEAVTELLRALAPERLELHLVHVFEPDPDADTHTTLNEIRVALEAAGLGGAWVKQHSDPVHSLIEIAQEQGADLIAIGAPVSGEGRIAKGLLARSPVSLLIAKRVPKRPQGLVAVLATDHSDYMDGCLERLKEMHPTGLSEVVVLTANEVHVGTAALLVNGLPQLAEKAEGWMTEKIEEENRKVCSRLAPLSRNCRPIAREGYPNEVIRDVMKEVDADLLVLGAPKHRLLDRLVFGSVSFDEVVNGGYSVLALRHDAPART